MKKKTERNQLKPLQNTGKEIAIFLSDWLIRYCEYFKPTTDQGHGKA